MEEAEKSVKALGEWAKQDKENRAVIVIAYERGKENEASNTLFGMGGNDRNLITALTLALPQDNKKLAKMVGTAAIVLRAEEVIDKIIQ